LVADLLRIEPHTPSPEPRRYEKNGGDWYNHGNTEAKGIVIVLLVGHLFLGNI